MDEVMLSIYVTTYNHGKYIAKALDSILMQKTHYSYEVLIGDDVSQDNTREILKSYNEKYPGVFSIFYRDHNMNNEYPNNGEDLRNRCKGKYVIALEGDDYWTDESKIEKQIDFLENHPDFIAVSHNCVVVDEASQPNGEVYPECKDSIYTFSHYISGILPGQFATVMYRNYLYNDLVNTSILTHNVMPTDRLIYFMLLSHGRIACMQDAMSAYRHVSTGGSSYSANYKYNFRLNEEWNRVQLEYAYILDNVNARKCAEVLYVGAIAQGYKRKLCTIGEVKEYLFKNVKHPLAALMLYICYKIRKDILKKSRYLDLET